jgi:phage terminase large subunit-like protein
VGTQRPKRLTRGERNCVWIELNCVIPEGKDVGKPVRLRSWQRKEIKRVYDNPHGTRRAILSFGRKNGKTALASFLLLLHLVGPEARSNSQLFSAAQSRDQAAILFGYAAKCVRMSPRLQPFVHIRDTAKQLFCPDLGTLYRALSAEASTAYGLSPVFVVHDELGQVKGPRSELYEALETATGAQEAPLSVIISTQSPADADLLSVLIDDGLKGHDKRVVVSLHTAPPEMDPFSLKAIKAANPAFGDFLNATEAKAMAEDARRMPSRQPEYENLVLNRRVEMSSPAFPRAVWMACVGKVAPSFQGLPVYGGLDLSETTDLTALVLVAPQKDVWHVKPTFWLPGEGLRERARLDRVPYDTWHKQGHLQVSPGKSVEYQWVAEYLRGVFDRLDVRAIAFDRWNWRHLRPWLLQAGFTEKEVTPGQPGAKFVEFGQGFASMSPAMREAESAILNGRLVHDDHPVMNMCMGNAVVQTDPAGNRKLTKAKSHGRIDGAVALLMAMSLAATHKAEPPPSYQMFFVV